MTEEVRKYLALQKRLNARSPLKEGVRVLPVTKTVEPARILPLKDAGAAEIGENRVQEALEKLPLLKGAFGIRIIGRLQTNKARYVARRWNRSTGLSWPTRFSARWTGKTARWTC